MGRSVALRLSVVGGYHRNCEVGDRLKIRLKHHLNVQLVGRTVTNKGWFVRPVGPLGLGQREQEHNALTTMLA